MYSASHVEAATNFCLFDCHAMAPLRQNAIKPEVDRRVSGQAANSESEKACIGEVVDSYLMPC